MLKSNTKKIKSKKRFRFYGKINKRKESYNTASYKKNNYYTQISNIPKDMKRALKYTNDNITSDIKISNNTNNTLDI